MMGRLNGAQADRAEPGTATLDPGSIGDSVIVMPTRSR
jgi:hypothetical protein